MEPQIEITKDCNLACDYCFQDHSDKKIMSHKTLENVIDQCVAYLTKLDPTTRKVRIYWHGGEALMAGIDFFRKILEIEEKYPEIEFENPLQTNAIAMTRQLAEFFAENDFQIGFSLDGPEDIQNRHRVLRDGKSGSFKAALRGIEYYRKATDLPLVPVIAVISKYTIERGVKVFYEFFRDLRTSLQIQPYDITCYDLMNDDFNPETNAMMASPEEYGQFVKDLFDLWFYDDPEKILIKELKHEIKAVLAPVDTSRDIVDKKRCSTHRTIIDPDGWVFGCDMYVNTEKTALGNINTDPLDEIMERKYAMWEDIKTLFRKGDNVFNCNSCKYGYTCSGGCMTCMKYNYLTIKGYTLEDPPDLEEINNFFSTNFPDCGDAYFCKAFKIYRKHIEEVVRKEMANA